MKGLMIRHALSIFLAMTGAFICFHIAPADPARATLGIAASERQVQQLRSELGLDAPILTRFARFVGQSISLNFGSSYRSKEPVRREILQRAPNSLLAIACGLFIYLATCALTTLLILSRRGSALLALAHLGSSIPSLVLAVLAAFALTKLGVYLGVWSVAKISVTALIIVFPLLCLSIRNINARLSDPSNEAFIGAARSRGASPWRLLTGHLLPHVARVALLTLAATMPTMVGVSVLIEIIFSIPGIGPMMLDGVLQRDMPRVEGAVLFYILFTSAVVFICELSAKLVSPQLNTGL